MPTKRISLLLVLMLTMIVTGAGCTTMGGVDYSSGGIKMKPGDRHDPLGARFLAASIKRNLRHKEVVEQAIVVTTFVDLNNLSQTSVFGRLLAERTLNEMHQSGFTVSEIRKGRDIFLRRELGELILTRDARESLTKINARAILVGTYVATAKKVIINTRLIDVNSPLILSSAAYDLRMNEELKNLLTGESPF